MVVARSARTKDAEPDKQTTEELAGPVGEAAAAGQAKTVAQQLDPLTSTDAVALRTHDLTPEEEVAIDRLRKYRPPAKRQRPGNAFLLAYRNFMAEFRVRSRRP